MGWLERQPLSRRLLLTILGITLSSVLLGALLIMLDHSVNMHAKEEERVRHLAALIADVSRAPLAFADPAGVMERLAYLDTLPDVLEAAIYDTQGELFACWQTRQAPRPPCASRLPRGSTSGGNTFVVYHPVVADQQPLGQVVLLSSQDSLKQELLGHLFIVSVVMALVAALAFIMAQLAQRAISRPVRELAEQTRSLFAEAEVLQSNPLIPNEIEALRLAYAELTARILRREHERDRAQAELQAMNDTLEFTVAQRTQELQVRNSDLAAEIEERRAAEARLERLLHDRETLLREVHHRVKNNLQVVYGLLTLQAHRSSSEENRTVLDDSRQRVHAIALVHESLYQSEGLDHISSTDFVQQLIEHLWMVHRPQEQQLRLSCALGDFALTVQQAVPLGLILNELLTNILKYAFPSGMPGHIEIDLRLHDGQEAELVVQDNGVGMAATQRTDRPASLGLQLINSLSGQLRGRQTLSTLDPGTRTCVRFPWQPP